MAAGWRVDTLNLSPPFPMEVIATVKHSITRRPDQDCPVSENVQLFDRLSKVQLKFLMEPSQQKASVVKTQMDQMDTSDLDDVDSSPAYFRPSFSFRSFQRTVWKNTVHCPTNALINFAWLSQCKFILNPDLSAHC